MISENRKNILSDYATWIHAITVINAILYFILLGNSVEATEFDVMVSLTLLLLIAIAVVGEVFIIFVRNKLQKIIAITAILFNIWMGMFTLFSLAFASL